MLPVESHNGELLDDAFFDFFQTIVIFIKNLLRPVKIDRGKLRGFPVQAGHKVKVIIQKTVLMAVLAFLLHAVQHFFSFFTGFVIHAGFFNLFLKFPGIGNIFRVKFVQFFLKITDLLLDGCLAIKLLLIIFLSFLCFGGNFGNLHKFVDGSFDQRTAFPAGIRFNNGIFFFGADIQIFRKGRSEIIHIFPL